MTGSNKMYSLLLLSGGVGARSKLQEPKQFFELQGHPLIAHTLIIAQRHPQIAEVIVNYPGGYEERTRELLAHYCSTKPFKLVAGGATRQDSCKILVEAASNEDVIVHEAARPLCGMSMFEELIDDPRENVSFVSDIPFSMCKVDGDTGQIVENVSRDEVFNIQLPQKFSTSDLASAHSMAAKRKLQYTEDAVLVADMTGKPVFTIEGRSRNIKITTVEDLYIAEQIAKERRYE